MGQTSTLLQRHRAAPGKAPHAASRNAAQRPAPPGVPRFLAQHSSRQAVNDAARYGTQGVAQPLPHRDRIERAFGPGHDLSSVRAHVGERPTAACDSLGAAAFAAGSSVAFGAAPDAWLAAHEAAHVIQQRHGEGPAGALDSPGDGHERQASAVADRVVAGQSARDLLPRGGPRGAGASSAVQRYTFETTSAGNAQLGEGKQTALLGSQQLYAAPALIGGANAKLQASGKKGSYIELKAGGGSLEVDGHSLTSVQPEFLSKPASAHSDVEKANAPGGADTEGTANGPMALWSDCGRSSAAVTGSSGGGDRSVVYYEKGVAKLGKGVDDPTVSGWLKGESNTLANRVYMDLLPGFISRSDNAAYVVEGVHYDMKSNTMSGAAVGAAAGAGLGALLGSFVGGVGAGPGAIIGGIAGGIAGAYAGSTIMSKAFRKPATIAEAKAMYLALGNAGMDKFDKEAGINFYANPEIGESYSMATEGDMPGFRRLGPMTWNFHWAGVIMKDGSDNITLENYAVTREYAESLGVRQRDFINRDWTFLMYGTKDKSQTFHQQHLDTKTHGSHATSIAVRTDR
jgi:hypothetical protein